MILSTIDRYIGKSILGAIFATLFALVGLSAIIKFVEQFRSIGEGTYDIWKAGAFTILTIPKDIETFFPMAALLGGLIALGGLASRSELVVMQSAGLSRFKIALSVLKAAIPLVFLTMLMGEWGVPQSEQYARNMRAQAFYGGAILTNKNSIWAKDGNNFVYIQRITDNTQMHDLYIYAFNNQHKLESMTHADSAQYVNGEWKLVDLKTSTVTPERVVTSTRPNLLWKTTLTPDKLGIASLRPTSLSISGLYRYVQFMKQTGQDAKRFELTFWQKIFQPITVSIMMLLALSFIFGQLRGVSAGARIVTGICFGFLFYVINEVVSRMSLIYNISPVVGAIIPSIFFVGVIWWLLHKKS